MVQRFQVVDRHFVLSGDARKGFPLPHRMIFVGRYLHHLTIFVGRDIQILSWIEEIIVAIGVDGVLHIQIPDHIVGLEAQRELLRVSGDNILLVLRIQGFDFIQTDIQNSGNLLEMDLFVHHHGVHIGRD